MRLLSYNIHKGIGGRDRLYRLARIMDVIEEENPDLVCLQEVVRDTPKYRLDNQPSLLAERLQPAAWLFQCNVHYRQGGYGNLLLSRWPVSTHHHVSLRLAQRKPRGAQLAVIRTPQGPLQLVNWHLGLAEKERRWQVSHLLKHASYAEGSHLPTIIVGDFNDWRNTLAFAAMAAEGLEPVTHPASRFRTFPAWMPMGSLDKAFYRGPVEIGGARVVKSRLARVASDHLPLVIDFDLKRV